MNNINLNNDNATQIFNKLERQSYNSTDVIVLSNNSIIGHILEVKFKKMMIKKDEDDNGRFLSIEVCNNPNSVYYRVKKGETFGIMLIDETLGPDYESCSSFLRKLRKFEYGGIVFPMINHEKKNKSAYKRCGADGVIYKYKKRLFPFINNLLKIALVR